MPRPTTPAAEQARRRRWRLLLGEPAAEPLGAGLTAEEQGMDEALGALYDEAEATEGPPSDRRYGALGSSAPRWPAGSATSGTTSRPAWSR